jgi:hypothetical protein
MISAAATATESARNLNNIAARATSRADATREAVILQGQQTRLAQEAIQTQTVFAQNIAATATMHSAHSTATASAAQFTATANAINIEQTRVSASATATAHAASAQRTRESGNATATRESEDARTLAEKQQWERNTEAGRALAMLIGLGLFVIGGLVVAGFGSVKAIDALVLRARVFRGKGGTVVIVPEANQDGHQQIYLPERAPGAVVQIFPKQVAPLQIESGAIDADTTKRDQAIALLAASHQSGDLPTDVFGEGDIQKTDAPPAQLLPAEAQAALDGEWRVLDED